MLWWSWVAHPALRHLWVTGQEETVNRSSSGTCRSAKATAPTSIAEIGSNHNGDMDLCRRLIDAAADAGARRGQVPVLERVVAHRARGVRPQPGLLRQEEALRLAARDGARLPAHARAAREARALVPKREASRSARARSRPEEVDLLDELDVPFIKIASMDVTNLPLLRTRRREAASRRDLHRHGRRWRRSSGRSRPSGTRGTSRSCCCTACPSIRPEYDSIHLRNIADAARGVRGAGGLQRPHAGYLGSSGGVALGACLVEKHFTIDKDMAGWDHAISADPEELRTIVDEGRNVFGPRWAAPARR